MPNSSLRHISTPTHCDTPRVKHQYYTLQNYWVVVANSIYHDEFVVVTRTLMTVRRITILESFWLSFKSICICLVS